MKFKDFGVRINLTFGLLGLILLVMGLLIYSESIYAGVVYMIIGFFQILIPAFAVIRMSGKKGADLGNVIVMASWWILSVGIAGVALFTSPLLAVSLVYTAISTILAILWIVLSAISIKFAISETGARLVV